MLAFLIKVAHAILDIITDIVKKLVLAFIVIVIVAFATVSGIFALLYNTMH